MRTKTDFILRAVLKVRWILLAGFYSYLLMENFDTRFQNCIDPPPTFLSSGSCFAMDM